MSPLIMIYMYVLAFWFYLQTKPLAYNLLKINKGKENQKKFEKCRPIMSYRETRTHKGLIGVD